jgi:hypothetical protein
MQTIKFHNVFIIKHTFISETFIEVQRLLNNGWIKRKGFIFLSLISNLGIG